MTSEPIDPTMSLDEFGGPWRIELHDDGHGVLFHGEQDVALLTLDHELHSVTLEFADGGGTVGTEWRARFMIDAERWLRSDPADDAGTEGADAFTEFLYLLLVRAQEEDEPDFEGDASPNDAAGA